MDSCVIPLRHGGLSLVQTTDFFYPLVEDPYMMVSGILLKFRKSYHAPHKKNVQLVSILLQGRIACANVLSDLYAMGITECDNMLMLLSVSQKMNEKVR